MMKIQKSALVPFTAQQMFALVADIESYPQFLPWCAEARLLARGEHDVTARVALAKSGIRQAFTTHNRLHGVERIDMQLVDGPFKRLHGHWSFQPVGAQQQGCLVALHLEFEFSSKLLAMTFGKAFHSISSSLIDAFCARARDLYGYPV
jgi:ribosome-associated toxin RatA of RatAB toxin-antitoxin module